MMNGLMKLLNKINQNQRVLINKLNNYMKVKDLIKMLLDVADDDTEVHLSIDEEGNGYGDVSESPMLTKLKKTGGKCVVLFPQGYYQDEVYEDE